MIELGCMIDNSNCQNGNSHFEGAVALSPRKKTHSNKGLSLFCFHDIINLRKKNTESEIIISQ